MPYPCSWFNADIKTVFRQHIHNLEFKFFGEGDSASALGQLSGESKIILFNQDRFQLTVLHKIIF